MQATRICTACLATDVRMYGMSSGSLLRAYQLISGRQVDEKIPQHLCWECAALVNKFMLFRDKCERAYLLLQDICSTQHENLEKAFKQINRHTLDSTNHLSVHKLKSVTFDPTSQSLEGDHFNDDKFDQFLSDNDADTLEFEVDIKKEEDFISETVTQDDLTVDLDCVKMEEADATRENGRKKRRSKKEKKQRDKENKQSSDASKKKSRKKEVDGNKIKLKKEKLKKTNENKKKLKLVSKKRIQPNKKIDCSDFATEVMLTQEQQTEEVRKRQETAGYRDARYKCALCFKGYIDEKTYSNHMLKHDPVSGAYQCDVCSNRFKQRRHVVNHIYKVHMSKYLCKFCPYVSQSPEQASNHNKWHTGVTYKCDICSEVFTKKSTHLSHVRIKHPSQHICGGCGESFVSKRGLVLHTRLMHKEAGGAGGAGGEGPYCGDCRVQFTSAAAWRRHMIISPRHADDEQFINGCRDCGESFASAAALRLHARAHARRRRRVGRRLPAQQFPAPCAECSETVESAMQYWQHFRRAHPDRKYPAQNAVICEYCGKGFQTNAVLAYHRHTHTGKRSYQCAACPKSFFNPTSLATHARSHDDSRPHVCGVCRKGFKVKPALARHVRIHTGEKPYACEVCGKAFSDASSRKLHVRTVHLKEPAAYSRAR